MNSQQLFPLDFPIGKSIIRYYIYFAAIIMYSFRRTNLQNKSFHLPMNSVLENYKYKGRTRLNIECK